MLRVIDTSVYQQDLVVAATNADAFIVKATGGNGYVNPDCDDTVQQVIAANKPWGVYHYFGDGFNDNDPISEADWFISQCQGYLGKGQVWLDWERGGNPNISRVDMALAWLEHIRVVTGYKPAGMYMSLSIVLAYDWSPVINAGYALWCADYIEDNTPITNFAMDPNRDPNPNWDGTVNDVLWQFTSTGRIDGYGGNLDCSFFYGTRASWDAYAGIHTTAPAEPSPSETTTTTTTVGSVTPDTTNPQSTSGETATTTTSTSTQAAPAGSKKTFWQTFISFLLAIFKRGEK